VAEQERIPNKERRAQARAQRKAEAEAAAKKARQQKITSSVIAIVVVAAIVGVVITAFTGREGALEEAIVLAAADADAAQEAAGCEVVSDQPQPDASHFDLSAAPPASDLYTVVRPTHSGPHANQTGPLLNSVPGTPLDERAYTHNLEHGAIMAWFDPEQVDGGTVDEMQSWMRTLNASGFEALSGGGIIVSPFEEEFTSGKPIALRAWGLALDCDEWDETAANGFVVRNYGSHGAAPERNLSPYPEDAMRFSDETVDDNTEADTGGGESTEEPTDGATAPASEEPTEAES
jgi:hypothetical protein